MPRITNDNALEHDWVFVYTQPGERIDNASYWVGDIEPVEIDARSTRWRRRIYDNLFAFRGAAGEPATPAQMRAGIGHVAELLSISPQQVIDGAGAHAAYSIQGYSSDDPSGPRWAFDSLNWDTRYVPGASRGIDLDAIVPEIVADPPHHIQGCVCNDCNPCCCGSAHCVRCHPEGPAAAGCDCHVCHPEWLLDDQGDDDTWDGLPEMPDPPSDRCRFGIEIEFNQGDRRNIMSLLQRHGLGCLDIGYTHETVRHWKMTTDASVSGGELVSPVLAGDDASIDQVRQAIKLVKQGGGVTGRNVGMHVHLDITDFGRDQLLALADNLRLVERFYAAFIPTYRYAEGSYTRLFSSYEWYELRGWLNNIDQVRPARSRENRLSSCPIDRYRAFNFNSLLNYGTVECRLLGHTLNTNKVRTWIRALQALIYASRQEHRIPIGTDVLGWLIEFGGLESEYADHFRVVVESRDNTDRLVAAAA